MPDVGLITHLHISHNQSNWGLTVLIKRPVQNFGIHNNAKMGFLKALSDGGKW